MHEKLLNFAAPQLRPPIDWDAEMLYDSLFQSEGDGKQQQSRQSAMETEDDADDADDADDLDDDDDEEQE